MDSDDQILKKPGDSLCVGDHESPTNLGVDEEEQDQKVKKSAVKDNHVQQLTPPIQDDSNDAEGKLESSLVKLAKAQISKFEKNHLVKENNVNDNVQTVTGALKMDSTNELKPPADEIIKSISDWCSSVKAGTLLQCMFNGNF